MRRADAPGALELLFLPWALAGPCSWNTARAWATGDMDSSWPLCGEIRLLRTQPMGGQVLYGLLCPVWKEVGAWLSNCSSKKWPLPGLAASSELRAIASRTEHWKRSQQGELQRGNGGARTGRTCWSPFNHTHRSEPLFPQLHVRDLSD